MRCFLDNSQRRKRARPLMRVKRRVYIGRSWTKSDRENKIRDPRYDRPPLCLTYSILSRFSIQEVTLRRKKREKIKRITLKKHRFRYLVEPYLYVGELKHYSQLLIWLCNSQNVIYTADLFGLAAACIVRVLIGRGFEDSQHMWRSLHKWTTKKF